MAYLEAEASEAAKNTQSIFSENLASLIVKVRPQYSLTNGRTLTKQHFEVVPAASLYYISEDKFIINCYLRATLKTDGKKLWHSRYVINSAREYSRTSASIKTELQDHLSQCFSNAMDLLALHIENGEKVLRETEVDFGDRTAVVLAVHSLLPERLVYYDTLGLFDLDKKYWRAAVLK